MKFFKKFPHFQQLESNDCGPACLKIIFEHYGYSVPFKEIRNKSKLDWKGTSLYRIETIAKEYKFKTIAISCSWEKFSKEAILPAIAMINQRHYAVVYKITSAHVCVSDPAIGRLKYTIEDFKRIWETESGDGIALLLHPTEKYRSQETSYQKSRDFSDEVRKYINKNQRAFIYIFCGLLMGSAIQLLLPFSTQIIVDEGIGNKNLSLIVIICLGQMMFLLSRAVIDLIRRWILIHLATIFNISLIHNFLLKLIKLPLAYFEFRSHGDLLQRVEDHKRIDRLINSSSLNAAFSLITFILYGIILLIYNKYIFIFFILFSIIYFAYNVYFTKYRELLDYKRFQKSSEANDSIFQMIFGINEIKIYQAESLKLHEWKRVQHSIFKINIQSARYLNFQEVGSLVLSEGKNFAILFYCSYLVIQGHLTLGMMLSVQYIIGLLNVPLFEFIRFLNDYTEAKASYERIVDIYDFPDEQSEIAAGEEKHISPYFPQPLGQVAYEEELFNLKSASIDFSNRKTNAVFADSSDVASNPTREFALNIENASFTYQKSYGGDDEIFGLQEINFKLEAGKKLAIVGSSGSGKTTLLKLLLRFYPLDSGNISVNDEDFYKVPVEEWRSLCSSVMQDGYIFSDTIANNIALGDPNPCNEKVQRAAKLAEIHDFIFTMPGKFETFIGNNGQGLSQGQKQRILIARAIYKDSPFFFFDEATSSLDSLNERNIMDNIYNHLSRKTMIIIAHRLSTVVKADEILVMDKGRIVERGTHRELVENRGYYFNLVKNQLELAK
ncbi:peptidase domain-containing ABC transporter [Pedobacter sp. KBS0701]|uniref:peptidase domain-containing ABC transporter n=1 Tax=Pedobacter sp. KBS0701 TaxID=2578106 RepID=UPI00110DD32D|nr:peptidase domain-containing ABC transporter [Pedobacter sp. KBS0701]QDW24733.1 peptidase domain-containing ABC transporter [Pedobacter sp. KBS0701]